MRHVDRKQVVWLEAEFLPLLPRKQPVATKQYKTCAVVANGGEHLKGNRGPEIDAHEAVFRINYAPVTGPAPTGRDLSAHVGKRTTFDVLNRPNAGQLNKGHHRWRPNQTGERGKRGRPPTVVVCETPERDARREQFLPLMRHNPDKQVLMLAPEAIYTFRFVWHELKKVIEARDGKEYNDKPMTGWTTTMLALQVCEQVNLYGFMPYTGAKGERYHYFDKVTGMTSVHSFDLAYDVFKLLSLHWPVKLVGPLGPPGIPLRQGGEDEGGDGAGVTDGLGLADEGEWRRSGRHRR